MKGDREVNLRRAIQGCRRRERPPVRPRSSQRRDANDHQTRARSSSYPRRLSARKVNCSDRSVNCASELGLSTPADLQSAIAPTSTKAAVLGHSLTTAPHKPSIVIEQVPLITLSGPLN